MADDLIADGVDRKAAVSRVVDSWDRWLGARSARESVWHECRQAAISQFPEDTDVHEMRSQRFMPETRNALQTLQSQVARGAFPNDQFFAARGDNEQARDHEELRTVYMRQRLEAGNFAEKYIGTHLMQLLELGASPYMLCWERTQVRSEGRSYEYETEIQDPVTGMTRKVKRTYQPSIYAYDGPDFRPLDLFNFVIDPENYDNQRSALKIYRTLASPATIKRMAKNGQIDETAANDALEHKGDIKDENSDSHRQERMMEYGLDEDRERRDEMIEIHYAHGDIELDDEVYWDHWVIILGRKHLACFKPNEYDAVAPLRLTTLLDVPGSPYGIGIVESALPLQDAINAFANQDIDVAALEINPIYKKKATDEYIRAEDLISVPGAVVEVEEMDNIEVLHHPSRARDALQQLAVLKSEFVDATMSWKNLRSSDDQTATAAAIDASMMSTAQGRIIQRLESLDIEPILRAFDDLEKQYYDPEGERPFARYEDRGQVAFQEIAPEVIYQDYTWKAMGSNFTHTRALEQQQLLQMGMLAAQTPAAQSVDWQEYLRTALSTAGRRDVDKLVPGYKEMLRRVAQGEAPPPFGGGAGITPGSQQPQGMAPSGRGAIPNAGGGANALQALGRAGMGA